MGHDRSAGEKCPRCLGRGEDCLCARLVPQETRTRFVVLQHLLEVPKRSNTVRLAPLLLPRCEVRRYGDPEHPLRLDDLEGAWLLWPGDGPAIPAGPRPSTLVVLDGSWSQARRMSHRLEPLRRLPRLSLDLKGERHSLREAPEGGVSSLEAIAHATALLEDAATARPIFELYNALCARQLSTRGYVGRQR